MKPQERLVRVTAHVEPDLRRALEAAARRNRRTMSNYLRDLLAINLISEPHQPDARRRGSRAAEVA
jgi:hypothetical protein